MELSTRVPQGYVLKGANFYECLKCGCDHVYNVEEHEEIHNTRTVQGDYSKPRKEYGEYICAACGVNLTD